MQKPRVKVDNHPMATNCCVVNRVCPQLLQGTFMVPASVKPLPYGRREERRGRGRGREEGREGELTLRSGQPGLWVRQTGLRVQGRFPLAQHWQEAREGILYPLPPGENCPDELPCTEPSICIHPAPVYDLK